MNRKKDTVWQALIRTEEYLEGKFTVHLVDLKYLETGRTRCGLETLPEGHESHEDVSDFSEIFWKERERSCLQCAVDAGFGVTGGKAVWIE